MSECSSCGGEYEQEEEADPETMCPGCKLLYEGLEDAKGAKAHGKGWSHGLLDPEDLEEILDDIGDVLGEI